MNEPTKYFTFGDGVLSFGGYSLQSFVPSYAPFQRYETSLFKSSNGMGVSAGSVTEQFRNFDEIGIRLSWESSREVHGCNWLWFPGKNFTADTGNQDMTFMIANNSNYYVFQTNFNFNNTAKTFTCPNDQSSQWWGMRTPVNSTGTIVAENNAARHRIVAEIIGVKYQ